MITKTTYKAEQKININDVISDIEVQVIVRPGGENNIKLLYFSGNNDIETYNWFSHIEEYIRYLSKEKLWDVNTEIFTYTDDSFVSCPNWEE
jgi:hypothetical protein